MTKFNEILKKLRVNEKLTQSELGERVGVTGQAIANYESGRREPALETLEAISDYFNVDLDYLMGKTQYTTRVAKADSFTTVDGAIEYLFNQKVIVANTGINLDTLTDDEKVQFANRLLDYARFLKNDMDR